MKAYPEDFFRLLLRRTRGHWSPGMLNRRGSLHGSHGGGVVMG